MTVPFALHNLVVSNLVIVPLEWLKEFGKGFMLLPAIMQKVKSLTES